MSLFHLVPRLRQILPTILAVFLLPVLARAASLTGRISDLDLGEGLPGVMVGLLEPNLEAKSDAAGRYAFDGLAPGNYTLRIRALGYDEYTEPLTLAEGENIKDVTLSIGIMIESKEVTVTGRRPLVKPEPTVSSVTIEGRTLRKQAGALEDVTRVVQSLPGVVTEGDFAGVMYVRGGSIAETQFLMDGAILANPYHFGGLNTIINPELIDSVDFYAGAFPARYANVGGGIIDTHYIEGSAPFNGAVDISLITAKVQLNDATEDGTFKYVFASRYTYFEPILYGLDAAGAVDRKKIAIPGYSDTYLKLAWQPNLRHKISLMALYADDRVKIGELEDSSRPDADPGSVSYTNFIEIGGLTWRYAPDKRHYFGALYNIFAEQSGGELTGTNPFDVSARAEIQQAKLEAGWLPDGHKIEGGYLFATAYVGVDGLLRDFSYLSRGGNYAGADPNLPLLRLSPSDRSILHGVFLQDEMEIIPDGLRANVGARMDYWAPSEDWLFSPRASVSINLARRTLLKGAWGIYYQGVPNPLRHIAEFNKPVNRPWRSDHHVLGIEQGLGEDAMVRLEGYYKRLSQQISNYDSLAEANAARLRGDPLFGNEGTGYSYGVEAFFQRRESADHFWDGWISYGYALTRYKNPWATESAQWFYPRQDQRHTLSVTGVMRPVTNWSFSGKFQFFTGKPVTPLKDWTIEKDLSDPESGASVFVPVFGALNSARLPAYHRLDIRAERGWKSDGFESFLYFEIMNIYNQKNLYLWEFKDGDIGTGERPQPSAINQLPLLPFLGYRAQF